MYQLFRKFLIFKHTFIIKMSYENYLNDARDKVFSIIIFFVYKNKCMFRANLLPAS